MKTTDELALLAAISAQPDEDTPRLMYADVLEDTDPARAELIRVQCELARLDHNHAPLSEDGYDDPDGAGCAICDRLGVLRVREDALLAANETRWRKGPACVACDGDGKEHLGSNVRTQRECPGCHGSGDAGGLMQKDEPIGACRDDAGATYYPPASWTHTVTYHRGMVRVKCRAEDVWEQVTSPCGICRYDPLYIRGDNVCPACQNTRVGKQKWQPTAWATAVCRSHPDVIELWVSDREPTESRWQHTTHEWGFVGDKNRRGIDDRHVVPQPIFDALPIESSESRRETWMWYVSKERAMTILSRTIVQWIRER